MASRGRIRPSAWDARCGSGPDQLQGDQLQGDQFQGGQFQDDPL